MTTKTTDTNGHVRKTLASQLDRLDTILDTLGEGLNEAVAGAVEQAVEQAVREGVRQGVRGALTEVLGDPDVLAALRGALAPEPPASPRPPARRHFDGAVKGLKGFFSKARAACGSVLGKVGRCASAVGSTLGLLRPVRSKLLTALGVGALAGVGLYFAGPWLAALAGSLVGFGTTLAVQARHALARLAALALAPA